MSKGVPIVEDHHDNSSFTLTFTLEILGMQVEQKPEGGWLELGPCVQGFRIQYQLYPFQNFDLDVMIWPQVAKIWCCGKFFGWVRTYGFLDQSYLSFSVRHAFPVRIMTLRNSTAVINVLPGLAALGPSAKSDHNTEVYIPPVSFGEHVYFASVLQQPQPLEDFVAQLVWKMVEQYIPVSDFDGKFDTPYPVSDVRNQDASLYQIRDANTIRRLSATSGDIAESERRDSKTGKAKKPTPKGIVDSKFEIRLSGDTLLASVGRVIPFEVTGTRSRDLGDIVVLASTGSLPALDDLPMFFVNVYQLCDVPVDELAKQGITQIYTRWKCNTEDRSSKPVRAKPDVSFNDQHAAPLQPTIASQVIAAFLEEHFEIETPISSPAGITIICRDIFYIRPFDPKSKWTAARVCPFNFEILLQRTVSDIILQLRGIREVASNALPKTLFGQNRHDKNYDKGQAQNTEQPELDVLVAVCLVDLRQLSKGNTLVSGEYPLYPPRPKLIAKSRDNFCTNDINRIGQTNKIGTIVPPSVILEAQMTLSVSIGFVGCRPPKIPSSYLRLFSSFRDVETESAMLERIVQINENLGNEGETERMLTGWMMDTGLKNLIYLEGPTEEMWSVWDLTRAYHPSVKMVFSMSKTYANRVYPEFLAEVMPFMVLKLYTPLATLLSCPQLYVPPTLPEPTRSGLLKLGRLAASERNAIPARRDLPTATEVYSFRLELCIPSLSAQFHDEAL